MNTINTKEFTQELAKISNDIFDEDIINKFISHGVLLETLALNVSEKEIERYGEPITSFNTRRKVLNILEGSDCPF